MVVAIAASDVVSGTLTKAIIRPSGDNHKKSRSGGLAGGLAGGLSGGLSRDMTKIVTTPAAVERAPHDGVVARTIDSFYFVCLMIFSTIAFSVALMATPIVLIASAISGIGRDPLDHGVLSGASAKKHTGRIAVPGRWRRMRFV